MNPWWAFKLDDNNKPQRLFPKIKGARSQDLPDLFSPTGAIWMAKANILKEYETFYTPEFLFFELEWKNAVDIDNYEDLEFAKIIANLKKD